MKFTKEQLLDALKAKLTANGKHLSISDKTIKSLSDSHFDLLVNEETELDDLVKKILPQYVSLNGNYEKDNADFIKKWKIDHPDKTPKDADDKDPKDTNDPALKTILDKLKALEEKDAAREAEKLVSNKRSELLAKFKEKGIKDSKWVDAYMKKLQITKDSDIDQEFSDAEAFYNLAHSTTNASTPGSGSGGESGDKVDFSDVVGIINPDAGK